MKNNNVIIYLFFCILIILTGNILYSAPEVYIQNWSSDGRDITVKIYPVSMVFNGHSQTEFSYRYDFRAIDPSAEIFNYINGVGLDGNHNRLTYFVLQRQVGENLLGINHDINGSTGTRCSIGFGKYRIEFWWSNIYGLQEPNDYCTIEYDAGSDPTPYPFREDVYLNYYDDSPGARIMFNWAGSGIPQNIDAVGNSIVAWDQYGNNPNGIPRSKGYGNFI